MSGGCHAAATTMFGTAGPTDPYFANVVSLLHFNGTNGSTTFTDEKGKTWTANGSAALDTSDKKFGSASLYLSATGTPGNNIQSPTSADWAFGNGDFTIEMWAKQQTANIGAGQYLGMFTVAETGGLGCFLFDTAQKLNMTSVFASVLLTGTAVAGTGSWDHYAWSKETISGTAHNYLFFNGVQCGTNTVASNFVQQLARIGRRGGSGGGTDSGQFQGWIDEFRATKGVCRYNANFTPPTAPFPNS